MSRRIFTLIATVFLAFAGVLGNPGHTQSLSAGAAFSALKGNTTIDRGGSIHSQARSIYSLGGGMTTFTGKRVTFLSVDPPSFSAGCAGISWHFGGFSFISMDELRQLVEAISQAALGIAVDLAIQTLCPQCYAVMSKLRDMANLMRNAAADACRIAQNMGRLIGASLGVPMEKQTECAEGGASSGETGGFLNSMAGKLCRGLDAVNKFLDADASKIIAFLNGDLSAGEKTPSKERLAKHYNVQYEVLTALGFADGIVKDLLLNYTGLTIYHPGVSEDCREAFKNLGDIQPINNTPGKKANASKTGSEKGLYSCHAPPQIASLDDITLRILCGFDPTRDANTFIARVGSSNVSMESVKSSALGSYCLSKANLDQVNIAARDNPSLYSCRLGDNVARCVEPRAVKYNWMMSAESTSSSNTPYTGLGWMVVGALYEGARQVRINKAIPPDTLAIIKGAKFPLYRLINLAAVYPGMVDGLLDAYGFTIATQYIVDLLDQLARPGRNSTIESSTTAELDPELILKLRSDLANMLTDNKGFADKTLMVMSQKRALVQHILELNRALQADVIAQGLAGNERFAVTLKKQLTP